MKQIWIQEWLNYVINKHKVVFCARISIRAPDITIKNITSIKKIYASCNSMFWYILNKI